MHGFVKGVNWGAGCLALLILTGCGTKHELAPVTGQVTCEGEPVPGGVVILTPIPISGTKLPAPPAMGRIDENGKFELYTDKVKGAWVGKHRVSVNLPDKDQLSDLEEDLQEAEEEGDDPRGLVELKAQVEVARRVAEIPCRQPSETEFTVQAGQGNTLEIKLETAGRQ